MRTYDNNVSEGEQLALRLSVLCSETDPDSLPDATSKVEMTCSAPPHFPKLAIFPKGRWWS